MSQERIVFTNSNGAVGVIIPTGTLPIADVLAKDVPHGAINARQCTVNDLPDNRNYRNAWDDTNPENFVGVNPVKAGDIAHGRRRVKRDEAFKPHLVITGKQAQGIPLAANEDATVAIDAMSAYKTDVDDVLQIAIDEAIATGDVSAMELAEIEAGIL